MDDSIQTLKDEMNKLMSVYEHVKLKPEDAKDKVEAVEVNLSVPSRTSEKSVTPIITEMGQSVLEVVGDEAVIRFKAEWRLDLWKINKFNPIRHMGMGRAFNPNSGGLCLQLEWGGVDCAPHH